MHANEESFLNLIRPHWRRLNGMAAHYANGNEDANDLVQETLLRAWRGYSPLDEKNYRSAWLFVIMRNIVFEWQRSAASRVRLKCVPDTELTEYLAQDLGDALPRYPSLDEKTFRELLDERLASAFDALEPASREVILLSVEGDLNYREIAEVLGCPIGTVMSRMARARRALRERLSCLAGAKNVSRGANR